MIIEFEGKQHEFPDDFKPEDISAALSSAHPEVNVPIDVAKSGGVGVGRGLIGMAGMPGDVGSLVSSASNAVGIPQSVQSAVGRATKAIPGLQMLHGPTSDTIQHGVESVTGPFYKPQSTAGEYAQTAGEFLPAAAGGLEGLGGRLLRMVVAPAVASETAGQLSKGTAVEPIARAVSAVGATALAHRAPALSTTPTAEQAIKAAQDLYQSPAIANVSYRPDVINRLADDIIGDLKSARRNERLAPTTHYRLEEMKTPVGPSGNHTIEDVETTRRLLGEQAGNFANKDEQAAATIAIKKLDKFLAQVRQPELLTGDAREASQALLTARANYSAGKTAAKVSDKLREAELEAGSTHSGSNIDNATRRKLRRLLTSKKEGRGLTDDELALVESNVLGSRTANAFRAAGKFLGGGGGLGALVTSDVGHRAFGPGGLIAPLVGYGLKKTGDALTRRNANKIVQTILDRSPEAARLKQTYGSPILPSTSVPNISYNNPSYVPPRPIGPMTGGLLGGMFAIPQIRAAGPPTNQ